MIHIMKCWSFIKLVDLGLIPISSCLTIYDVIDYCMSWREKRDLLPYEIDGMVIKVNS